MLYDNEPTPTLHNREFCWGFRGALDCCGCPDCKASAHANVCQAKVIQSMTVADNKRRGVPTAGDVRYPSKLWLGKAHGSCELRVFTSEEEAARWGSVVEGGVRRYVLPLEIAPEAPVLLARTIPVKHELYNPAKDGSS